MIQQTQLQHRFVKHIPEQLELGVLYVSLDYGSAAHSCCCGCGEEVVTPITPTDWKLTYDGESISLWPSIGNWNLRCRSHYIIERGRVLGARPWTDEQIVAERRRDKAAKADYYTIPQPKAGDQSHPAPVASEQRHSGRWARFKGWICSVWVR